jgi:pimeloyl-ACP methyl ester carboxylesterase
VRHWANAIDLEQISFSFQDDCRYRSIAADPTARLLLAAGDEDNFDPVDIFNSTIDVARLIRRTAHGKAEFWSNTGHSVHSERPRLFAREIVYFLTNPDASGSLNGAMTSPQRAGPSRTDQ